MRSLVDTSPNPIDWFEDKSNLSPADARRWLRDLSKCAILFTKSNRADLLSTIRHLREDQGISGSTLDVLQEFIGAQPKVYDFEQYSTDFHLGADQPYQPLTSELANSIIELFDERSQEFRAGMSARDAYDQVFRPFMRYVKSVTIVDPYLSNSVGSKRRSWLLEQLLADSVPRIHVVTSIDEPHGSAERRSSEKREVERRLDRLARQHAKYGSKVTAEFYLLNKRVFHHRRIRFQFDDGSIYVSLESGIDGFATGEVIPGSAVGNISERAYGEYLSSVRSSSTRL